MKNVFKGGILAIGGIVFAALFIVGMAVIVSIPVQWLWNDVMFYIGLPKLSLTQCIKLMILLQILVSNHSDTVKSD